VRWRPLSLRRPAPRAAAPPRSAALGIAWMLVSVLGSSAAGAQGTQPPLAIRGDSIPTPLTATPGDPARGRSIVVNRQVGLCLLCHNGPFPEERFQGNLATNLSGTGTRWSAGQLRLRIVDSRRIEPDGLMPAFHRSEGLERVGPAWRGKTILDAQQVEDVVAFLLTLRGDAASGASAGPAASQSADGARRPEGSTGR
jgi:L-cysteine S-thiosulfotransferase